MSHALYRWTYHFEGVKRVCSLPDERHCIASAPSLPDVIKAILAAERKCIEAARKRGAKCPFTKATDIYPVDMHFLMDGGLTWAICSCSLEQEWFKKNLHKVRAAFGIDADESDTYLVVEE